MRASSTLSGLFAVLLSICLGPPSAPLSAQENLAAGMEAAIAQLRAAGQGDEPSIAHMLNAAAEGYLQQGDLETALARVREALAVCRKHDADPTSPFFTASKILSQADDDSATAFLLAELDTPDASPTYRRGLLKAMETHLAIHGDQKLRIQAGFETLQLVRAESPGTEEEFWALFNFANHCLAGRLYDQAGPALRAADALAGELGRPELAAHCARSIGFALAAEGDYDQALGHFQRDADLNLQAPESPFVGLALRNVATTLVQMGRPDEAEAVLEKAGLFARDPFEEGFQLEIAAAAAFRSAYDAAGGAAPDLDAAIRLQEQAVERKLSHEPAGEEVARLATIPDYVNLGSLRLLAGDLDGADEALAEASLGADAWERSSREAERKGVFTADQTNLSLADIRAGIADFGQQIALRRDDPEGALVIAENGRGAAQAAILKERLGFPDGGRSTKEMSLDDIRATAREHGSTLLVYATAHAASTGLRRFHPSGHPLQQPRSLLAWVVTPDGAVHFVETPLEVSLAELVREVRDAVAGPPQDGADPDPAPAAPDPLRALSALLIDPVRGHLPQEEGALLTVVPQGELFLVPFSALPDERGRPLVEDFTISQSPSIELLGLAREQKRAAEEAALEDILVVGNPTMPGYRARPDRDASQLSPLPGAEAEAKHLGQVLGTEPLIGDAATESAVAARMEGARILHFATHGLLEAEDAYSQSLLSSLAFAPSEGDDGFLTAKETARMTLRAELAVLSACDTGRGMISGDGVVGLARGYISAGVPTVVVSLWPVNDAATAQLMADYYQALLAGRPKAEALRLATLRTRERFPSPQLWAPFVSYGLAE